MTDVYASFGLAGYKLTPVPLRIQKEVNELIEAEEKKIADENNENSLG